MLQQINKLVSENMEGTGCFYILFYVLIFYCAILTKVNFFA